MKVEELRVGQRLFYLSHWRPGYGPTRQIPVDVVEAKGDRVRIQHPNGRIVWVKAKNLQPIR